MHYTAIESWTAGRVPAASGYERLYNASSYKYASEASVLTGGGSGEPEGAGGGR